MSCLGEPAPSDRARGPASQIEEQLPPSSSMFYLQVGSRATCYRLGDPREILQCHASGSPLHQIGPEDLPLRSRSSSRRPLPCSTCRGILSRMLPSWRSSDHASRPEALPRETLPVRSGPRTCLSDRGAAPAVLFHVLPAEGS